MRREQRVIAPDGRQLMVDIVGSLEDPVVFFLHGTPGSRRLYAPFSDAGSERGLCHVCYSRPGYDGSDRNPGRVVFDGAADMEAVADDLGVESFYVLGESGGGPHALAVAARLKSRVSAVATICCPGDMVKEPALASDTAAENEAEDVAARAGEGPLLAYLDDFCEGIRAAENWQQLLEELGGLTSPADRAVYAEGLGEHALSVWRQAASTNLLGWADDDIALVREWGFDLGEVEAPVTLWQGGDDRTVPRAHGEWLNGQLPAARLNLIPGEGHNSIINHYGAILDDLLELGRK
jgi:pimeloyl-ACP methyl ester carboxylesterase